MLTKNQLTERLEHISYHHRGDTNGNVHIAEIIEFAGELSIDEIIVLGEILIDSIEDEEYNHSFNLSVLAAFGDRRNFGEKIDIFGPVLSERLSVLFLATLPQDTDRRDHFIEVLANLRHKPIVPLLRSRFLELEVQKPIPAILLMALLCRFDDDQFVETTAVFLAKRIRDKSLDVHIQGMIPYVLVQILGEEQSKGDRLITELIAQTRRLDMSAGNRLRATMIEWVNQEDIRSALGEDTTARIDKLVRST